MAARLKKNPAVSARSGGALYFYGVSAKSAKTGALGMDGDHLVESIFASGLNCWVARVSNAFVNDLERRMEDLEWLAEASVRHQRAVAAIAAKVDLLPARFGAVFLDEASLGKHIAAHRKQVQSSLKKVADAEEWGVKVFVTAPAASQAAAFTAASGSDYLRHKAKNLAGRSNRTSAPDAETQALASALSRLSRATAPTGKVSGAQPGLQWQASFLLPRAKRKQWDKVLQQFAVRWGDTRRIECTGPWPAYSFVE